MCWKSTRKAYQVNVPKRFVSLAVGRLRCVFWSTGRLRLCFLFALFPAAAALRWQHLPLAESDLLLLPAAVLALLWHMMALPLSSSWREGQTSYLDSSGSGTQFQRCGATATEVRELLET